MSDAFDSLSQRLEPFRNHRIQAINKIVLNAIKSKIQILFYMIQCFSKAAPKNLDKTDSSIIHLDMLLGVLLRSEEHITDQEVEDSKLEIKRLHRIVEFDCIKKWFGLKLSENNTKSLIVSTQDEIFANKRYTDDLDDAIKIKLKAFNAGINITNQERIEIVNAIGLSKGHWYKCPNGHPYAIGECGGAVQIGTCFCGAKIGGTSHRLLQDNNFAGEMDGAIRHAWAGPLH